MGKVHAKFNPVATVSMRYEPEIKLNYDLLDRYGAACSCCLRPNALVVRWRGEHDTTTRGILVLCGAHPL